jgi:hypothetical protein
MIACCLCSTLVWNNSSVTVCTWLCPEQFEYLWSLYSSQSFWIMPDFLCSDNAAKGKAIPVTGREGSEGCETSRLPHFLDSLLTDGVRLSAPCTGCPLPPGRFMVLISIRGWVDPSAIVWLEGLGQLKNPMTSLGIEPATFWLVA